MAIFLEPHIVALKKCFHLGDVYGRDFALLPLADDTTHEAIAVESITICPGGAEPSALAMRELAITPAPTIIAILIRAAP